LSAGRAAATRYVLPAQFDGFPPPCPWSRTISSAPMGGAASWSHHHRGPAPVAGLPPGSWRIPAESSRSEWLIGYDAFAGAGRSIAVPVRGAGLSPLTDTPLPPRLAAGRWFERGRPRALVITASHNPRMAGLKIKRVTSAVRWKAISRRGSSALWRPVASRAVPALPASMAGTNYSTAACAPGRTPALLEGPHAAGACRWIVDPIAGSLRPVAACSPAVAVESGGAVRRSVRFAPARTHLAAIPSR